MIPEMTRVALLSRKDEMIREDPTFDRKKFLFYLSRSDYQKRWGKGYRQPGAGTRVLAWFLKMMPKIGPFRALQFKIPTTQTEGMYIKGVDRTVEDFQTLLQRADANELRLENRDCDTGKETAFGEYRLERRDVRATAGETGGTRFRSGFFCATRPTSLATMRNPHRDRYRGAIKNSGQRLKGNWISSRRPALPGPNINPWPTHFGSRTSDLIHDLSSPSRKRYLNYELSCSCLFT